jgi:hypothetical protein
MCVFVGGRGRVKSEVLENARWIGLVGGGGGCCLQTKSRATRELSLFVRVTEHEQRRASKTPKDDLRTSSHHHQPRSPRSIPTFKRAGAAPTSKWAVLYVFVWNLQSISGMHQCFWSPCGAQPFCPDHCFP